MKSHPDAIQELRNRAAETRRRVFGSIHVVELDGRVARSGGAHFTGDHPVPHLMNTMLLLGMAEPDDLVEVLGPDGQMAFEPCTVLDWANRADDVGGQVVVGEDGFEGTGD